MGKCGMSQPCGEKNQISGYHLGDSKENGRKKEIAESCRTLSVKSEPERRKGRYHQQDIVAMLEKIQMGSCRRRVEDEVKVCALCAASISVSQTRAARVEHCAMPKLRMKSGSKTFVATGKEQEKSKMPRRKYLAPRNNKQWYPLGAVEQKNEKLFSRTAFDVQECDLGRDCQPWRMENSLAD